MTLAAPKNGEAGVRETGIKRRFSVPVATVRGIGPLVTESCWSSCTSDGRQEAFAIVLPTHELEQSVFVAFSPKNGPHRASRRLAGRPGGCAGRRAIQ
ncbi:hypothetical protein [Bradyrhizobium lablabi]|uniref:hypothetical protein n=1 Tax=Bradyrhizobium lablabi TaxID=722472 RepID=UPI0012E3DE6E|nr:hypothetical protein [Bradyrhizobium lablabi]